VICGTNWHLKLIRQQWGCLFPGEIANQNGGRLFPAYFFVRFTNKTNKLCPWQDSGIPPGERFSRYSLFCRITQQEIIYKYFISICQVVPDLKHHPKQRFSDKIFIFKSSNFARDTSRYRRTLCVSLGLWLGLAWLVAWRCCGIFNSIPSSFLAL